MISKNSDIQIILSGQAHSVQQRQAEEKLTFSEHGKRRITE